MFHCEDSSSFFIHLKTFCERLHFLKKYLVASQNLVMFCFMICYIKWCAFLLRRICVSALQDAKKTTTCGENLHSCECAVYMFRDFPENQNGISASQVSEMENSPFINTLDLEYLSRACCQIQNIVMFGAKIEYIHSNILCYELLLTTPLCCWCHGFHVGWGPAEVYLYNLDSVMLHN